MGKGIGNREKSTDMVSIVQTLRDAVLGPQPVRWAGELYGNDTEFRFAVMDGVEPSALKAAARHSESKDEFRRRVLDSYYDEF
jgi:hypothetical protein